MHVYGILTYGGRSPVPDRGGPWCTWPRLLTLSHSTLQRRRRCRWLLYIYRVSQKIYWLPLGLKIAFLWGQSFINNETIIECFKMFTFLGYFRRKLNILFITLNPTIVATALWQIWKIPSPGKRPMFEPRKFRAT